MSRKLTRNRRGPRKPNKEPLTFNRPRLYYQPTNEQSYGRIRIVYPTHKLSEWFNNSWGSEMIDIDPFSNVFDQCCWDLSRLKGKRKLTHMKRYDQACAWPEAEFICEL